MGAVLDQKDIARYPFLKEAQRFLSSYSDSPQDFLASFTGKRALSHAVRRVRAAIGDKDAQGLISQEPESSDSYGVMLAVAGYALARVIVSCSRDRMLIERLCRYEAEQASAYLVDEVPEKRQYVIEQIGLTARGGKIPLMDYVELAAGMKDERWRLVNRELTAGEIRLHDEEFDLLLKERIRVVLYRPLPLPVPGAVCEQVSPIVAELSAAYQARLLEAFGPVEESSFPPCIQAILSALTAGTNITHSGRFALTAFLHTIGMDAERIIEVFRRAPDFDQDRTRYQVEHITGRGGTEYTPPACAAMRTTGLCIHQDALCGKVSHPLKYYTKKKGGSQTQPKDDPGRDIPKSRPG